MCTTPYSFSDDLFVVLFLQQAQYVYKYVSKEDAQYAKAPVKSCNYCCNGNCSCNCKE